MIPPAASSARTLAWRGGFAAGERAVAEEVPVAFTYNRATHAVMMATPVDLEDFAIGFSRSEAIIDRASDVEELEIIGAELGLECRMWIAPELLDRMDRRRRVMAGPTGCGLCGLDSLAEAARAPAPVRAGLTVSACEIEAALAAMPAQQPLNARTRSVHAAAFWQRGAGLTHVREDVGRHNALDKLGGALARAGIAGEAGMIVMTSRISVELVQKAAAVGASILVAVSAPTALALRMAEAAGITLIGVARQDGFEVFTHPERLLG